MPLVTASPGTCPRWTSRDMAKDDRPARAGVGGAAREPRACPGGWTPAASPPSLNLPTSPLSEPWLSGCQVLSGDLSGCRALSGTVRCLCQTSCQVLSVLSGAVGCVSDRRGDL